MKPFKLSFLAIALVTQSCSSAASTESLGQQAFKNCAFEVSPGKTLNIGSDAKTRVGDDDYCAITLVLTKDSKFETLGGMSVTLNISKPGENSDFFSDYGFRQNGANWNYVGNPFTIGDVKFKNLRVDIFKDNEESFTLVGQQTEYGFSQKGAPLMFLGAQIVRKTPLYYVQVSIASEPMVSDVAFEEVKSDLVRIVKSVKSKNQ